VRCRQKAPEETNKKKKGSDRAQRHVDHGANTQTSCEEDQSSNVAVLGGNPGNPTAITGVEAPERDIT